MYKLFEKESILAYILYGLILVLLCVQVLQHNLDINFRNSFLLNYLFHVELWNAYVVKWLIILVFFIILFIYSRIYAKFSYYYRTGLIFQLIFCINLIIGLTQTYSVANVFALLLFFILSFILLSTDDKKNTAGLFFNIGFIYGISLLSIFESIVFLPAILMSTFIFGKNGVRDFIGFLFGLIVPLYILVTFLWYVGNLALLFEYITVIKIVHYDMVSRYEWIIIAIVILSAITAIPIIPTSSINTRKFYSVLLIQFFVIVPIYIFLSINENKAFLLIMTLASFYFTPYFLQIKMNKKKSTLLIFGILMAIIATFVPLK